MKNKNKNGFTLIELLVVVAIISLLSSIVFSSLSDARVRARDARRTTDIKQLVIAIQSYVNDNGTFPSNAGCSVNNDYCCLGHGSSGTCWKTSSGYHGSDALDSSLLQYISEIPDDPLNNTSRLGDAYMYLVDANGNAALHWGIENSNPSSQSCAGGTLDRWNPPSDGNGGGYHCTLYMR